MAELKAIETRYKGYRFRSRLEARWAVFFEALGIPWEYEKEGFDLGEAGWYLPDFWLPEQECWFEVKGNVDCDGIDEVCIKPGKLAYNAGKTSLVAVGSPKNGEVFPVTVLSFCDDNGTDWSVFESVDLNQEEAIKRMFDNGSVVFPGVEMHCPLCDFEFVHVKAHDITEILSDNYEAWEGRGSAIRIIMGCEYGCCWTLRIGFHKGISSMAIEDATRCKHDPLLVLANRDSEALAYAIEKMTSARFEHGERG